MKATVAASEAIWPAQIHDCKAAIRWIRANAKKYKGVSPTEEGSNQVTIVQEAAVTFVNRW